MLTQSTTIRALSAETTGQENIVLEPVLVNGANFAVIGTLTNSGASFSPSSITAKVQTAIGNDLKLNGNLPGSIAAGQIILDVTRSSYAFVDVISGSVATVTQPLAASGLTTVSASPSFAEDNGWSATDTYQLSTPSILNLKVLNPIGVDGNSSFTAPGVWVQNVYIPDNSGTPGNSQLTPFSLGASITFTNTRFDCYLVLEGAYTFSNAFLANSWMPSSAKLTGDAVAIGGAINTNNVVNIDLERSILDGDVILHNTVNLNRNDNTFGQVHVVGGPLRVQEDSAVSLVPINLAGSATSLLWGAATVNVCGGQEVNAGMSNGSGTWANSLKVTTLEINGATTAFAPPVSGTFTANGVTQVTVTGSSGSNAFPANATISFSMNAISGTPVGLPYFSANNSANNFFVKSVAGDASVYNWSSNYASGVTLTSANLDTYNGLSNPRTGCRFGRL